VEASVNLKKGNKLGDHLRELRNRFFVSVLALITAGIGVFLIYAPILEFLREPLGQTLYYDSPAGSFSFILKVCLIGGLAITIPIIVYNLAMFIRPAFKDKLPKRQINSYSFFSGILAIAGMAFGYYVILPGTLHFFAGFQIDGVQALISADNYLNFVTNILLTFILVFQIPLLISFMNKMKPISPSKFLKGEKWVILGSLIVSLLVPFSFDLITSLLISLPIVVLYNLSFAILFISNATTKSKIKKQTATELTRLKELRLQRSLSLYEEILSQEPEVLISAPYTKQGTVLDIQPMKSAPAKISPASWVIERNNRTIQPADRNRIISDIRPAGNSSRFVSA